MGNSWRRFVLIFLLVLFFLQAVQSIATNDSAGMQETAGANKLRTTNKRGGGGRSGGARSGGGRSGGGRSGDSSGNGDGRGSDGTSSTPDGRLIPLVGGALAGPRNGAATGHRRHNAASSRYSCSLPIVLSTAALEAVFLTL